MKLTKRILAVALSALMLLSLCATFVSAATSTATVTPNGSWDLSVFPGVNYSTYLVSGSSSGHSEYCYTVTANPDDGYVAIPYAAYGGNATTVSEHVAAAEAEGMEVVAAINGGFFDTASDTAYGTLMSNGLIRYSPLYAGWGNNTAKAGATTAEGYEDNYDKLITFMEDGSIDLVRSCHQFAITLNGEKLTAGFHTMGINRHHNPAASANDAWLYNMIYYYDRSCGTYTDTQSSYPGVEVVCEKLSNTDASMSSVVKGKVVKVLTNSYGASIGENQFVLYSLNGGSYYNKLASLKAGDPVEFAISQGNPSAEETMKNAIGAMYHCGNLVKDGVDLTAKYNEIGDQHYVNSTYARWTAMGVKADGSIMFFVSAGGSTGTSSRSLHLSDVANAMIKLGCVDVYRMDGGGSSALYLNDGSGYKYVTEDRSVTDVVLIVKKSSLTNAKLNAELATQISLAENLLTKVTDSNLSAQLEKAKTTAAKASPSAVEVRNILVPLTAAVEMNSSLEGLLTKIESLDITKYTDMALDELRGAYYEAKALVEEGANASQTAALYNSILDLLAQEVEDGENKNSVFVTNFNTSILSDMTSIFTPDFGTITGSNANHKWTTNFKLKWNAEKNCYKIIDTADSPEASGTTANVTLNSDEIFLVVHGDYIANRDYAQEALALHESGVDLEVVLHGIDVETKTIDALAYVSFREAKSGTTEPNPPAPGEGVMGDINGDGAVNSSDYTLLKRAVLGTYELDEAQEALANINGDTLINSSDYTLLKRIVLGTYSVD